MKIYNCMKCGKPTNHFYTMGDKLYKNPPNFCQACIFNWGDWLKKFKSKGRWEVDDEVWERAMNAWLGKNWRKYVGEFTKEKVVFT